MKAFWKRLLVEPFSDLSSNVSNSFCSDNNFDS